jgi:(1->4)-alpha-D-glucan 1-alpha-D-glucosylmutase
LDASLRGGEAPDYQEMIRGTKRRITDGILHSEMLRLARLVPDDAGLSTEAGADALSEIIAAFPVYRSYLPEGEDVLREACDLAVRRRPELDSAVQALLPLLLQAGPGADAELGRRFQQTSGMVMAKGVEDTAFFRYTRLGTLTEVGAEPTEFALPTEEFHSRMARRQAELPDGPLANLLWQAIAGVWPANRERLQSYARKAAREAGNSTDWLDPDPDFEAKLTDAVDAAFDNPAVRAELDALVALLDPYGAVNALGAKLVQLTMPGVPDVYQGTEFWDRSLTDPDNRRPFDFAARRAALDALDAGEQPASYLTDEAKLLVTSRALRLRRDRPELFAGYTPVAATGPAAGHLIVFDRGDSKPGAITLATRLPRGLEQRGGWQDTAIRLSAAMTDQLSGKSFGPGTVEVGDILRDYPVALLVPSV